MEDQNKYARRGVAAGKEDVHRAIKNLDQGLYPTAFCKILPDYIGGSDDYCNIMHADTAGTKTALAYLYYKETGDINIWKGIVQDAIVMNTDDMACVGCIDNIILSSTVGRNKHLIDGDVLSVIINEAVAFVENLRTHGVHLHLAGGETADVGDIVRTLDVGFTAFARMPRSRLVINRIRPGQVIVGFASYGQATYEQSYNSGIGSNGLTMARHELFGGGKYSKTYPETYAPQTDPEVVYTGQRSVEEIVEIDGSPYSLGSLVLSPTRTYLPLLAKILELYPGQLGGIIHNTGGAHTKVLKYLDEPVSIIKDNLLPVPPIFKLIGDEANTDLREMYRVFNMGTRLEIYTNSEVAQELITISREFNIEAAVIGRVEESSTDAQVKLRLEEGEIIYN